ncbi:MAG: cytochrome c biogenesis CcdA family protein [Pseudomonadota bacterium]
MELIFAYGAGLLTLINPCVLPVLPIVLASALNADRRGPIALALGMAISFVAFGMLVTAFGRAIGLTQETLANTGAIIMILFGIILLVPAFATRFELATAGFAASADTKLESSDLSGFKGQFFGGMLLGAVWSPCIGPTLGSAIGFASQGENLFWAFLIMCFFAAGVATLILGIGFGGQHLMRERATSLRSIAEKSKPVLGAVFFGVGLMILLKVHHLIEAVAIDVLPYWLQDLSVAL